MLWWPIDLRYTNQQDIHISSSFWTRIIFAARLHVSESTKNETTDIHAFMHNKQQALQRAFEPNRRKVNEKQKPWNAIYSENVHGPTYKEGQKILLFGPAIAVGTTSEFANPWIGPISLKNVSPVSHSESGKKIPRNNTLYLMIE